MEEVNKLKKELKVWETQFYKDHARKPSKSDIDTAPDTIKDAYSKYTKIKKILTGSVSSGPQRDEREGKENQYTDQHTAQVTAKEGKGIEENTECGSGSDDAALGSGEDADQVGDEVDGETVEVWGSQFNRKKVSAESLKGGEAGKGMGAQPAFLKNLGRNMFEQSLKMGSQQGVKPWKKPDTPRRGPVSSVRGRHAPPTSKLVQDPVIEEQSDNSKDSKSKFDTTAESTTVDCEPSFPSLFRKAATLTKQKFTKSDETNEPLFNKFQSTSRQNKSFLSGKLSQMVTKHRESMNFDEGEDNEEVEETFPGVVHDIEEEEVDKNAVSHSWNMSVSRLISQDEDDERKRKNAEKRKKVQEEKKKALEEKKKIMEEKKIAKGMVAKGKTADHKTDFGARKVGNCDADEKIKISRDKNEEESLPAASIDGTEENKNENDRGKGVSKVKVQTKHNVEKEFIDDEMDADDLDYEPKHVTRIRKGRAPVIEDSDEEGYDTKRDDSKIEMVKPAASSKQTASKPRRNTKKRVLESDDEIKDGDETLDASDEDNDAEVGKKRKKTVKSGAAAKRRKTNTAETTGRDDDRAAPVIIKKPAAKSTGKAASNGNFIKLNMKIKTYKRKGHHQTGPQYKRMMWKQKMQARSKSRGDACFKCGQSGHWANKCPGAGASNAAAKYEREPVNDEDFPSLQEAVMLARGCKQPLKKKPTGAAQASGQVSLEKNSSDSVAMDTSAMDQVATEEVAMEDEELEVESGITRTHREQVAAPPPTKPLLECGEGETLPAVPEEVWRGLRKFGFDSFRPGQQEAVMRILCGLSTLVVLSTGGGKSLCYQLPAYLYAQRAPCITLVVSPLVSLMEDQVTGLPKGIQGVCLHTNMTKTQRENVIESVKSGKAQFLLVSPEAIAGGSMSLLSVMSGLPPVGFVCIDEAHCLSEWSHNFRPSYLRLCKVLKDRLGVRCFLGLTATATMSTACDVSRHLGISDFARATVRGSPIPSNLVLSVSCDPDRDQALTGLLKGERFGTLDSIIIYCTRRDQTDKVATIIRTCMNTGVPTEKLIDKGRRRQRPTLEWSAESYHAGLTAAARKRVQNSFMGGKLRVVVATVAFGMGLDKSDVRGVIHYNMPKSFESYVQEIGRAGRDGERAECHVFLDPEGRDLCELRRHTYANTIDYRTLKKLVQRVFPPCRCRDVHEIHAQAVREAEEMSKMFDEDMDEEFESENPARIDCSTLETHSTKNSPAKEDGRTDKTSDTGETPAGENPYVNSCHIGEDSQHGKQGNSNSDENGETIKLSDCDGPNGGESNSAGPRHKERLCPGHERALPIQQTVLDLDVKEEGISTLLCYLELHDGQWVENLSNVYANCRVQCYGGPAQLQAVSKKCPPIAVAIARARRDGTSFTNTNSIEFSVIDVSDMMGWDSGPVKRELKLLLWNFDGGKPVRTGTMVEFTDLAFHFRSPGDFTTDELDDILQFLHTRAQRQERSEIANLSSLYEALKGVSHKNYWMCADDVDMTRNDKLKGILNQYFDKQEHDAPDLDSLTTQPVPEFSEGQLISDIRCFCNLYGQEHTLTGRAIARIFHGIASPCFPATTWGKVRRFWRSHLDVDFNALMKIATRESILFRT
ncbi:ATP-dependent DNA helicase Q4-like isoform X2 [Mya arenaria]|uniref:ATP-dependent DNA helicase Q4-like isoform X2 n=1 Tax=Mya arenaria TaxID=6604 RepID=UPI0022E05BBD|nr:ATP-dependent DNA helicase Q4-like isoform X2 [Mya arenaria]